MQNKLYCLLAGALLLALGGCGGGGGGGGGTAAAGGGTQPTETGNPLVAPAGPPGAVLALNATDLQPVRAGSSWEYRGVYTGTGSATGPYASTLRHVAGANGAVVEEATNMFQSGTTDKTPLFTGGGTVQEQVTDPLGTGSAETVMMTALRSPVRVNDQYVVFQRSRVDLGIDVDGDRIPDLADVVAYSTVVGTETLALPDLGRSLVTVRIDNTVVVRVTQSSDARNLPPVRTVQSDWYASGVGVVRRTMTEPSETVGAIAAEERLAYWDGVDQGLGATAPAALMSPAGGTSLPYKLPLVHASAAMGETALLVTSQPGIAVLDRQGVTQRLRPWPFPDPDSASNAALHAIGPDRALLVTSVQEFSRLKIRLQQLDAGGDPVGAPVTIDTQATTVPASAWDGNSLWLLWRRFGTFAEDIVLQPFGLDGNPREPAQVLERDRTFIPASPQLAAGGGRVLAAWVDGSNFVNTYKYTLRTSAGGPAATQTLGTGAGSSTAIPNGGLTPLVDANAAALYWLGSNFTARPFGSAGDGLTRIVALDAAGNVIRSAAALDDELLPLNWHDAGTLQRVAFSGGRLLVAGFRSAYLAPGATQPADALVVASVPLTGGALATAAAGATPVAVSAGTGAGQVRFGNLLRLVPWSGTRVTLIGDDGSASTFATAWLP